VGLSTFARIAQVFGGLVSNDAERQELFKEALLLSLSRATSADVNIRPVEIETVQKMMESATGERVTEAEIRVAAASELYERASLDAYLAVVGRNLTPEQRATIVRSLAEVIRSDRRISPKEVDFFNWVILALDPSPAEIAGLFAEG